MKILNNYEFHFLRNNQLKFSQFIDQLAVPANFVLPENVSLANDYTMLQKVLVLSVVCLKAPQVIGKCVGMTIREGVCRVITW